MWLNKNAVGKARIAFTDRVTFMSVLVLLPIVKEFPCGTQLVAHYAQEFLAFLQNVKV